MYDPTVGKWTSEVPAGFEAGDYNKSRYVENKPTNATDPTGMWLFAADENSAKRYVAWLQNRQDAAQETAWGKGPGIQDVRYVPFGKRYLITYGAEAAKQLDAFKAKSKDNREISTIGALLSDLNHVELFSEPHAPLNVSPRPIVPYDTIPIDPPIKSRKDYDSYPTTCYDADALTLFLRVSGMPEYQIVPVQFTEIYFNGVSNKSWLYPAACALWAEHNPTKKDWRIRPIEFRLTGLRFAAPGELGDDTGPRERAMKANVLDRGNFHQYTIRADSKDVPSVHFIIDGYYIFEATQDGKPRELFGVHLDFQARTMMHAPYDKKFADGMLEIRIRHPGATFGRPHDQAAGFLQLEDSLKQYKEIILDKLPPLKVMPGHKAQDIPNIYKLKS